MNAKIGKEVTCGSIGNYSLHKEHSENQKMFKKVNDTRRAFIPRENSCRSETGEIISDTQGVKNRKSEHIRELLGECKDQADIDKVFDKPGNTGSYKDIVLSYEEVYKAMEKNEK
ncbi:hypothetical protein CWI37_0161p0030 [Hamiltosporidium tvaerminnensis]|uniref:Uncharacterized protein n=1 Tax=Hamiltosporidium tvaerminnensis TaxID=1176355 RepID=A0A4Q9L9D4_9MICR|nr:hypothetical protein CWI37_0161p0030 [Hamiltosporidium tvaerminnensis]